ncbi:MAG TPA: metallophosphoesterase, partial [Candidatus Marinimicrobia bacterium]|nr:metallophosphoesterase [Candidatus Neomarinimicrobiota bacterium]
ILSVGDLIDGGTENRETLRQEWESFDVRASRAVAPVFKVGGNHDLTNLTMRDVWMERYGARYYHFIYKNVLFLALDSEDYSDERMQEIYEARAEYLELRDSMEPEQVKEMKYMKMPERATGEMGKEQSDFFLKVIAEHPNVDWTFLFMHKPVWLKGNDPEFATIESALSNRPYTLFNGHFHSYSHTIKNGRDYIMLGTTGGSQNAGNVMSFDHVTMVTVTKDGPTIGNLKLDGILDKTGHIPANGDSLCFQASRCKEE